MTLVRNDSWSGIDILIHDLQGKKKIYSSPDELNSLLQHLNYSVKNIFQINGKIFKFRDLNLYMGTRSKNSIMSSNTWIILELKSYKLFQKMSLENFTDIISNMFSFLPFNVAEFDFEIKRNFKVYE